MFILEEGLVLLTSGLVCIALVHVRYTVVFMLESTLKSTSTFVTLRLRQSNVQGMQVNKHQ